MGLDIGGLHEEAAAAYSWLALTQRPDGTWPAAYVGDEVLDPTVDTNFCAYVGTGAWHHYLATGDADFLASMWPIVEAALDFVLSLQLPNGSIAWAVDWQGNRWPHALLTSSSSIYLSVRSGLDIARALGKERPDWEPAVERLRDALQDDRNFEDKSAYAMDWYYPVLTGAVVGRAAAERLESRWDLFVKEGWGCLCTTERPWYTSAETCELIVACLRAGMRERAEALWGWVQRMEADDGLYWTGINHPRGEVYPNEKTTWSAGAVLLAANELSATDAARSL